ncbi:MAG: hypothetical protein LBC88_00665 [Spirochaetaceae bacterium]|jgi:hypothetical protein|nr:hypothetical protein [Spirochaetaceae bacterium]
MKKAVTLFFLTAFFAFAAFAGDREMSGFAIPTARANGMGGAHTAYTDNVFGLLVNPAAIMRVEQRSFFAISPALLSPESTISLIGPIGKMVTSGGNTSALGSATDILQKRHGKVPLGFDLREFPLSLAWVADGFGFGLWNRVFVNPVILGTNIDVNVNADVILPIGFAFRILDTESHAVDAGLTIKPFVRALASERVDILDLAGGDYDFMNNLSAPVIAGAGFDMGFMYRWNKGLRAALTFSDIITRGIVVANISGTDSDTYYVPFTMNAGIAYDFKLEQFWITAPRYLGTMGFTFAADWRDIMNIFQQDDYTKRNFLLNLSAGVQVSFMDTFMLRFGMNEMLPAVGVGFDLGPFEIDFAYYGREFGIEPGQLSAAAVDVTIAIRPGAKKRDWAWTRRSLVGLITRSPDL